MGGNHDKIDELIGQTSDPIVRATLLVLQRIDRALDENTKATVKLAEDLDEHRKDFRNLSDRELKERAMIRGAWWAGIALFALIQMIGGYVISNKLRADEEQNSSIQRIELRLQMLEYKLQTEK